MNKWIAIPVIIVLAIAVIGVGIFLWLQTDKLGEAEDEIVTLEGDVSNLEDNVSSLEGNVATLETDLAESEATVSTLETDLESANTQIGNLQEDLSTQRNLNSSLSAELKMVKDPRHFESLQELTDWLHDDDTDTKYGNEKAHQRCFILQVRALRDGYLLPVRFYAEGGIIWVYNQALIGQDIYLVSSSNDEINLYTSVKYTIPSHPLPLD